MNVVQEGNTPREATAEEVREKRRYWQLYKTVVELIKQEWMHVEEETTRVVDSVAHLRNRLWLESRMLEQRQRQRKEPPWKKTTDVLSLEDVELALQHDVRQHERMILALRKLLHQLSEMQAAVGRALERVLLLQHVVEQEGGMLGDLLEMHSMLARELYRKQVWMQDLMATYRDDCLFWKEGEGPKGWKVALQCSNQWSIKAAKYTCVDMTLMRQLFLLLEK